MTRCKLEKETKHHAACMSFWLQQGQENYSNETATAAVEQCQLVSLMMVSSAHTQDVGCWCIHLPNKTADIIN